MDLNSKFVLMKTFKIQPRSQAEQMAKAEQGLSDREKQKRRKVSTPLSLKSKMVISELLEGTKTKSSTTGQQGKSTRSKNRSYVDNSHAQVMYNMRLAASDFSAFLDNEMFRIRTEADRQKHEIVCSFEELCQRLARKLNYLQNYVEQQVAAVLCKFSEEKTKLDEALICVDQFLEKNAGESTIYDVQALQEALVCDFKDLPSSISIPEVVDPEELLETFTALIEGHICRQEIKIDLKSCESFLAKTSNHSELSDMVVSQSILRVNQNAMNQCRAAKHQATMLLESDFSKPAAFHHAISHSGKPKQKSYDGNAIRPTPDLLANTQLSTSPAGPATPHLEYALRRKSRSSTKLPIEPARPEIDLRTTSREPKPFKEEEKVLFLPSPIKMSLDLECHETMDAILPRSILHIEELDESED